MADYLPMIHYHARQEWQYRRTVVDPAVSRLESLRREHDLLQRPTTRMAGRRRRVGPWVGARLIRLGRYLTAAKAAPLP